MENIYSGIGNLDDRYNQSLIAKFPRLHVFTTVDAISSFSGAYVPLFNSLGAPMFGYHADLLPDVMTSAAANGAFFAAGKPAIHGATQSMGAGEKITFKGGMLLASGVGRTLDIVRAWVVIDGKYPALLNIGDSVARTFEEVSVYGIWVSSESVSGVAGTLAAYNGDAARSLSVYFEIE